MRPPGAAWRGGALLLVCTLLVTGCGSAHTERSATIPAKLLAGLRPIGAGTRFHPPVSGNPVGCFPAPGPERVHIELFAENKVVLIAGGVGHARNCYGRAVTRDPTGTVNFQPGATLFDLFVAWGQPLADDRLASFPGTVREYVNGRRVRFAPGLVANANIVLEVGPYVPPHAHFTFPP